ncbi:MAG: HD-GYP domain-containing protein [Spirochaetaceae bacterium]|nr:MAG: HD-GYP domain-containing protein [Spirochaetaceae bacterium]
MKTISVSELKPGQRFDSPVYVDGDSVLVPEGVAIRDKDIDRLRRWKVTSVTTEGSLIGSQEEGPEDAFLQQALHSPGQQAVKKVYKTLSNDLGKVFDSISTMDSVSTQEVDAVIDALFRILDERKNDVVQFILYGFQGKAEPVENAINCAVLATLVGRNMSMVKHKLLQLATVALLHDVGMLRLPPELLTKKGKLAPEELKKMRTHPIHSYKIITRELKYAEEIGLAALQHQERWDGAGYPRGISGRNIILPARIVSVVDSFEAMVSTRPYRGSMIGYAAMRAILSDNSRRFDPEVLKVFIRTMGIYPIGSIVLLSNGAIGRVLENNVDAPLKPTVKVMINERGREYPDDNGETLDLYNEKSVFIAKAVDPRELAPQEGS